MKKPNAGARWPAWLKSWSRRNSNHGALEKNHRPGSAILADRRAKRTLRAKSDRTSASYRRRLRTPRHVAWRSTAGRATRFGGMGPSNTAHRDERSLLWIEQTMQDLRYGLRTLSKSPASR